MVEINLIPHEPKEKKKNKSKKYQEFSKFLLIQESLLIWIMSLSFIGLAFVCVIQGYLGSLPWLAAMVSFPWAAYGVSQVWYYKKSTIENSKNGIKYEAVLKELDEAAKKYQEEPISINNFTDIPLNNSEEVELDPFGPI